MGPMRGLSRQSEPSAARQIDLIGAPQAERRQAARVAPIGESARLLTEKVAHLGSAQDIHFGTAHRRSRTVTR
jgi:hypothetical protein